MSYRWYYTDVAADGWTVVVIFMHSPVFSPRQQAAAVNVAAYRDGKAQHWAFSEYPRLVQDEGSLQIGRSLLQRTADSVHIRLQERTPFRRRPLELDLRLERLAPQGPGVVLQPGHQWQALMPRARAQLTLNGQAMQGMGYHDTNWGNETLRARWTWTRAHAHDHSWIHYSVKGGETHALVATETETTKTTIPASPADWTRSGWGLAVPKRVSGLGAGTIIESSPFYARLHVEDEQGDRLTEVADFARFQSPAFRWMPYFRSRAEAA